MKKIITGFIISVFAIFLHLNAFSQLSEGGKPISSVQNIKNIDFITISEIINDIPNDNDDLLKPLRFAQMINVNLDIKKESVSKKHNDGTLFVLGIISSGAYSLYPVFSQFKLPVNASLFIYNPDMSHVLGKFTSKNNKENNILAIMPIKGDTLIIEYFEPNNNKFEAELILGQIGHDYKGIFSYLNNSRDGSYGESGDCNIDINCFQGEQWQREKKSVCRIITGGSLCTGTLINNTNQNARPFFLTANHCINSQALADAMLIVFNYESPECNGPDGSVEQSLSGGLMRSTTPFLDFSLIELTESPLPSFNPYFAGWNWSEDVNGMTNSIHHPQGDVKKISTDEEAPVTSNYGSGYDFNTHWLISEWEYGTTEGGSSGSPLFDKNHRIIGSLTGGEANCNNPVNDYYSKFSDAWDTYPNNDDQLKFWLDPSNTGQSFINGYDPYYGQQSPQAEFSADREIILTGSTINYIDLSLGNVTSWNWTFQGAIPSQSTEQHPQNIKYTYSGTFKVTLEVTNNYGISVIIKDDLITVSNGCGRVSNLIDSELLFLYSFSGNEWGYWTGHNELGFSSFAEKYSNQSGNFVHGVYILSGVAYTGLSNSDISIDVWEGGGKPGNLIRSVNKAISSFTPGIWEYISFDPAVETNGNFFIGYSIGYSQPDTFAVLHAQPRGAGGVNTTFVYQDNEWSSINEFSPDLTTSLCIEPYICGSLSSISNELKTTVKVFPNPSSGIINVSLDNNIQIRNVKILNSNGIVVFVKNIHKNNNSLSLDLSHLSIGFYILIVESKNKIYTTKLQLIK